jgi:hypothetical protein
MEIFIIYVASWVAVGGLVVAAVSFSSKRLRARRLAKYEANPDPLFGKPQQ